MKFCLVRNFPESNVKTGKPLFKLTLDRDFNLYKALRGQQLWLGNSKMSTNSPFGFFDLGDLMGIMQQSLLNFKSSQVKVVAGSNLFSIFDRSSPILKDPKKAVQQAVQKTCLFKVDQFVFAIELPIIFSKGKVTALLVNILQSEYSSRLAAPFKASLIT